MTLRDDVAMILAQSYSAGTRSKWTNSMTEIADEILVAIAADPVWSRRTAITEAFDKAEADAFTHTDAEYYSFAPLDMTPAREAALAKVRRQERRG